MSQLTTNGKPVAAQLPCTLEQFLVAQNLLRSEPKVTVTRDGVEGGGVAP